MNDFKNWKQILYDQLFCSYDLGSRRHCKEGQKVSVVLQQPSFTFWVTRILCIWPFSLVRRDRYIWIARGPISWWQTNRVDHSHVCPRPTPILCASHKGDALIFSFFNQGPLGRIQVLVCAALLPLLWLLLPSCPFFWGTCFFKTLVGICEHPLILHSPFSSPALWICLSLSFSKWFICIPIFLGIQNFWSQWLCPSDIC